MKWQRVLIKTPYMLGLLALIDVGMRVRELGWTDGLFASAHDPGKVFFGVLLLPIAANTLIRRCPPDVIAKVWSRFRWSFVVVSMLFVVGVSTAVTALTTVSGFCERPPVPEDVANPMFQDALLRLQREGHRQLLSALRASWDLEKVKAAGMTANDKYEARLKEERNTHPCEFWSQSSLRAKWSGFLNFPAVAVALCFIEYLALRVLFHRPVEPRVWEALWIIVGAFLVWLPLHAYSEWWIHFGAKFPLSEMFLALIASGLAILLLFILRDSHESALRAARLAGAGSAIGIIVAFIKPEAFQAAAGMFFQLPALYVALAYLSAAIAVLLLAWYLSAPTTEEVAVDADA